ncbi:MAG: acetate/propionate family kinase [Thermoguttaceae bacterium]
MSILVFNAGSSSLKFGLFSDPACDLLVSGALDWAGGDRHRALLTLRTTEEMAAQNRTVDVPEDPAAVRCAIQALAEAHPNGAQRLADIQVVGHRVVHGGAEFPESVLIDGSVKESIAHWSALAPLHNLPALAAISAAEVALPHARQVAVFDTAFFAHLPPRAHVYLLPYAWYSDWGVRRFGFHGISHRYCAGRAAEILRRDPAGLRIINCHLGGGCSAAAIHSNIAVAVTMGFTPLDGLMMGTRPGSLDPGIFSHVGRRHGVTADDLDAALNHQSGLLGVSGVSSDFSEVERAAQQGNCRARLAVDMFADRVRSAVGALAVSMGGVDVLAFTDRVGENSPTLRAMACQGLECLGLRLDPLRNAANRPDSEISTADSPARILVIHTREELMIAREAQTTSRRNA